MENASKALIMAGGVLIGILIISLAVYLFMDFGATSEQINAQNAQQQIVEFNSKFTVYENYKDEKTGEWKITIYDIITLAGYANENNKYYGVTKKAEENFIDVKIGNGSILTMKDKELLNDFRYVNNGTLSKFQWIGTEYNENGRIKSISFEKN